jgi:hypothetical protein
MLSDKTPSNANAISSHLSDILSHLSCNFLLQHYSSILSISQITCMFYYLEESGKEECDKKYKSILPLSNPLSSSFSLSSFLSFTAGGTFLLLLLWKYVDKISSSIMVALSKLAFLHSG